MIDATDAKFLTVCAIPCADPLLSLARYHFKRHTLIRVRAPPCGPFGRLHSQSDSLRKLRFLRCILWVRLPTPYILSLRRERRVEDNAPYRFIRGEAGAATCVPFGFDFVEASLRRLRLLRRIFLGTTPVYHFNQFSFLPFIVW